MTRFLVVLVPIAACSLALAARSPSAPEQLQQQQPAARQQRQSYSDRYAVLSQRNIFLKDRSKGSSNGSRNGATTSPSSQPAQRPPEETLLLRGIVVEQGEVRAYFEDIVNSTMLRVAEGDRIARGRVAEIGLDAIEYEPASAASNPTAVQRTLVAVGNDLTGKTPSEDSGVNAEATSGIVMPTGVEGLDANDPNLSIEQRLKLRRMQELKK